MGYSSGPETIAHSTGIILLPFSVSIPPMTGNFNIICAVDGTACIFSNPGLPMIPLCGDVDLTTMKSIHADIECSSSLIFTKSSLFKKLAHRVFPKMTSVNTNAVHLMTSISASIIKRAFRSFTPHRPVNCADVLRPLLPSLLNMVLSLLALLLYSCRGDLDLSRLNLVKKLGLWRGLRERLCLLGDIVLDSEYADFCALVLFFQASPKLSLAFTSFSFSFFLCSYSYLSAMIGSSFSYPATSTWDGLGVAGVGPLSGKGPRVIVFCGREYPSAVRVCPRRCNRCGFKRYSRASLEYPESDPVRLSSSKLDDIGRVKDLGWRVMLSGCYGDLLIDRQMKFAKMLESKGVKLNECFYEGGYHLIGLNYELKAKEFNVISRFICIDT
ncbi:alpha/beta hydrolase fold-3 [Tanacetum coccineum]